MNTLQGGQPMHRLVQYDRLAQASQDPAGGLVMRLILDDEERHALLDRIAASLRDLAVRERGIDGGLDSVLLEMMALDSEKHARLLQFVERRLARAARD